MRSETPQNEPPLVTIGMPIFNEERYLEQALESLRRQDFRNLQFLISDNASTDDTASIGARAAQSDDRIIYIRLDQNIGAAANFRHVQSRAEGRYFMWAAGHDEWSPDLVSASVTSLEENPEAAIAVATSHWINADGVRQQRDTDYPDTRNQSWFGRYLTVFWGNMHPVLGLMRISHLEQTRGMQGFVGADLVLLSEMIMIGDFAHVDDAWWHRRDIRSNETHSDRMQRYTSAEYGQAKGALDKRLPLLRLPLAMMGSVLRARIPIWRKAILLPLLLLLMPLRYIVGRRKASAK